MTSLVIAVLVAAGGALAGIAVDRALLRRWIGSHGAADRRDDGIGESAVGRRASVRQAVESCERRTARADAQRSAAEIAAGRIEASLDALRDGVVVCDRDGLVVARNTVATEIVQARHGEALVAGVVKELLERASNGERAATDVELRAEPRRSYEV